MPGKSEIQDWLKIRIANLLQMDPSRIDPQESFANYGLSSLDAISLSGELEEFAGCRLSPTITYDYPNIELLSDYLSGNAEKNIENTALPKMAATDPHEPIAVIGMSCRFPGAADPDAFWQLLRDGVNSIREIPVNRWPAENYYHTDPSVPGKSISRWGGFLDSIDQFDAFYFGISPMEAKHMDPQQRLLLELSEQAIDDAGMSKEMLDGSNTGVFIGISINEYSQLQFKDPNLVNGHSGTGSALSIAANRISYYYNLRGPSMAIDTACSSSLSALHLACCSLRNNECSMAITGGVNIILSPVHSIAFTKAGVLAPDGLCKTFDANANGYVRGEGGGLVVLKKLTTALADGDPIQALILGSAVKQDGRTNGLMAPSQEGQANLLREAYKAAGIDPHRVQYVEAHGTGTLLGDSMEAHALGAIIGMDRKDTCSIGSVKTNIGHLEAAAGIAGIIKVILSIQHKSLPPSLHFHSPNPFIPFTELHLRVNTELIPWPQHQGPMLAGVSSFGFGGTNAHLVISEAVQPAVNNDFEIQTDTTNRNFLLLPLSARNPDLLKSAARDIVELLEHASDLTITDICHASARRRSHYDHRLVVMGNSRHDLQESLQSFLDGVKDPRLLTSSYANHQRPKLVFVFSGQGGQWRGMGSNLLRTIPAFQKSIEIIDQLIQKKYSWSLIKVMFNENQDDAFDDIQIIQPALFALQVALADLWKSWGIIPDAVTGHSMGEVAAAYIAGILTLEDAITIICSRSILLKKLSGGGAMIATELSPDAAREIIQPYGNAISLAVINSPASTVLSGDPGTIRKIMQSLQQENLFCKQVNVDVASHSAQVDPLRPEMLKDLKTLRPGTGKLPFYSTVTGSLAEHVSFDADYWFDNLRQPVVFSDTVSQLLDQDHTLFLEIGPHPVLLGSIQQMLKPQHGTVLLLPSLRREEPEQNVLFKSLSVLYTNGFMVLWNKLWKSRGIQVKLPPAAWQRQSYWMDFSTNPGKDYPNILQSAHHKGHPFLGERIQIAGAALEYTWQSSFKWEEYSYLRDHRMDSDILFPATAYIEMALQAAQEAGLGNNYDLADFSFITKLVLPAASQLVLQTQIRPGKEDSFSFNVFSRSHTTGKWVLHASARFNKKSGIDLPPTIPSTISLIRTASQSFSVDDLYQQLASAGMEYGNTFHCIQQVWGRNEEFIGKVSLPADLELDSSAYQMHPVLLDACLQVIAASQINTPNPSAFLPIGCSRIRFYNRYDKQMWCHVIVRSLPTGVNDTIDADILLFNDQHEIIGEIIGFSLRQTGRHMPKPGTRQDTWMYQVEWQPEAYPTTTTVRGKGQHWLIFSDNDELAEETAHQLHLSGDYCHLLPAFHTGILETFISNITDPLYGVIYISTAAGSTLPGEQPCSRALLLVQALMQQMVYNPRLFLVTKGAQRVLPDDCVMLDASTLWGLGKTISFEIPELQCVRVDLDPHQSDVFNARQLIAQLNKDDKEDQVAIRENTRYVQRLVPYSIKSTLPPVFLNPDGTYLVTGGMGGLGIRTALWLVMHGAKHLVLVGRTAPSTQALSAIEKMREQGAEVRVALADISDPDQVKEQFDNMGKELPVLRGVIHAAGILDDGSLLKLTRDRFMNVMASRVNGTFLLHQYTRAAPLDFFVLFSSAVSVLGSPGQGNYAAACAYLDAMAHHRHHLELPAISINWGPWAEVGLAAAAADKLHRQNAPAQHLVKVIEVERGLEILEQLLQESIPQVMVLPFDLKNLVELYPAAAGMPFLSEVGGKETHVARLYARPKLRQKYLAPRTDLEHKLAALWRQTLHIDNVGVQDSFFELGGDSVLAAQILSLVQNKFGIKVNPQDAFKAFTIERLAEMLEAELVKKALQASEKEHACLIPKRPENSPPVLSFPQQRQLFLEMLQPGTAVNNLSVLLDMKGAADLVAMENSANLIIARHEVLRTCFEIRNGLPSVRILEETKINIPMVDLLHIPRSQQLPEASRLAAIDVQQPFELSEAPLLRLVCYRLNPEEHLLLVCIHHTIADGWSLGVFLKEFAAIYQHLTSGTHLILPELPVQYADFAKWQTDPIRILSMQASLHYWKQQLSGDLPLLELPADHPRGAKQSFRGGTHRFQLQPDTVHALVKFCQQEDVTMFMTLLSAFSVLLHRYSGQLEIITGIPVANRNLHGIDDLVGVFINTIALRTSFNNNPSFRELLQQVKNRSLDAFAHQDLPFEKLVEELNPKRDLSRTPVFQAVFNLQNSPMPDLQISGLAITPLEIDRGVSQFELSLMITKSSDHYNCTVEYNADLFNAATIRRLFDSYLLLLEHALSDPACPLSELEILHPGYLDNIIRGRNQTETLFPASRCMHQLFEEQVNRSPDSIAVKHLNQSLSYQELNHRANRLAKHLQSIGVRKGFRVAVLMDKTLEIIEALLAVLKTGGTYIPISTSFPEERVQFILLNAGAEVVLTNSNIPWAASSNRQVVNLCNSEYACKEDPPNPDIMISAGDLAYIIYTSGSTGQPKGVMIPHAALSNFLQSMLINPGITSMDTLLTVTSVSFDIAALELFLPLIAGATVVIPPKETMTNPLLIIDAIIKNKITMMQATPAMWQLLIEAGWMGTPAIKVLCGGEALTRKLADELLVRTGSLWNMYGPTETTIWSAINLIRNEPAAITIGDPIANTQLYILDEHLHPVPIGVIGELHIGGMGLAAGYLDQPDLTAAKFIPDSFSGETGARLYKTGDSARYLPDLSIELLGRKDDQVKINGHRIELNEIRSVLMQHPLVNDAIALIQTENSGGKRLMAGFVSNQDQPINTDDLQDFMRKKLPAYMLPAALVQLKELPLTPHGKIDRRALSLAEFIQPGNQYAAPGNELEQILVEIWQNVLELERVGIHDNFFDLGGASIQSLQMVAAASMAGLPITPEMIFEFQTIAELAEQLKKDSF